MNAAQPERIERDERAVAAYVERLGDSLTDAGMPRLASRVFAQLLADDDGRMTASELSEALEVSPAAVSGAVRYLTQVWMIGKERERGSRRDIYVVQTDAWHNAMLSRDRVLAQLEAGVRTGVEAVGGVATPAGRRLQLTLDFLEFLAEKMSTLAEEWEPRKVALMASWPDDD
ncbi:transcriptional regulator TrmB [Intrasporangium oryzae NRRL B-24470]|uniref:Transcriptional regulator TrmB n=1 Tax=Intrasporangium oryzae NRRL B-24470 TaxID=1386089 RepID=W9GD59_9MICO|nr:MarR family transcriptional regulator [Intrasporangium oryzae]EWT02768.1 transcriptional regulator TrmB [Intrasporangium oryzae NRRL B-24470]